MIFFLKKRLMQDLKPINLVLFLMLNRVLCKFALQVTPVHALGSGIGPMQGLVMEVILTFSLLFVTYAMILDPRSSVRTIGPLLTGLIVGANTLAGGNFSGASMNPARSFGPALATGVWTHHWVYWVGPLVGGPLAGFVYESLFMVNKTHEPLLNGIL
jgi:aquaporin TIP